MEVLLPAERIQQRVAEMARQIAADYHGRSVTIVGVLTGCLMFLSDLVRHIDLPLRIGHPDPGNPVTAGARDHAPAPCTSAPNFGRTCATATSCCSTTSSTRARPLAYLVEHLKGLGAASLRTAVLLRKTGRQRVPIEPDYHGFDIPDVFVVGYGLDYNDEYRHLPYIGVLPEGLAVSDASQKR